MMPNWIRNSWNFILAKKKLLVVMVILYIAIMMVVYSGHVGVSNLMRTSQVNLRNIMNFESWNTAASPTDKDRSINRITKEFHGLESVDFHYEDTHLGHAGAVTMEYDASDKNVAENRTVIAIGVAITSKGATGISEHNIAKILPLFTTLLPSFCSTVSSGYNFQFYFAYDNTDPVFTNANLLHAFQKAFSSILEKQCPWYIEAGIHFVQCSHTGKPTWAQNDAMLEAYLDNVDYFYRINDDTKLQTKGWVEEFIKTLKGYDPPNVGVVGPNHIGGNTGILTYDFVHRTHVDIFGFYYPKLFTDWWGDDWVTKVYAPKNLMKLTHIRLLHTMKFGQRYKVDETVNRKLHGQVQKDQIILKRYVEGIAHTTTKSDGKMVIAMTLFGKDPKYTWGAIRNAQLMPIVFPQWTLRFYVPHPQFIQPNVSTTRMETVPRRILSKLKQLGSDIVFVRTISDKIPPKHWSFLVTMDETVDYFLIRDVDSRISDRDSAAVNDWMQETDIPALHCVRDHPKHADFPIVDGLWGGRTSKLRSQLNGKNLLEIVQEFYRNTSRTLMNYPKYGKEGINSIHERKQPADILNDILWPLLSEDALCHDSVSCEKWKNTRGFPVKREGEEYLGQKFDERQESISDDVGLFKHLNSFCDGKDVQKRTNDE